MSEGHSDPGNNAQGNYIRDSCLTPENDVVDFGPPPLYYTVIIIARARCFSCSVPMPEPSVSC